MTAITAMLGGELVTIHFGGDTWPADQELGLLGLDVESTYLTDREQFDPDFRVRLVQIGTEDTAWVFDLDDDADRGLVCGILSSDYRSFCSHTNMDVLSVWTALGIDISHRNVDTRMLATQADPDKDDDRDLKTLATKYGMPELAAADEELKAWRTSVWPGKKNAKRAEIDAHGWNLLASMPAEEWPEVFLRYAGLDAIACRRLAPILTAATQAPETLIRVDHWLHVRANRQQAHGKIVDRERHADMLAETTKETSEAKAAATDLTGGVNIGGPKILPWLAEHGVDFSTWPGATTDTGAPSLAKDNLKLLADYPLDETAQQVLAEMQRFRAHQDIWNKCRDVERRMTQHADGTWRIHPLLNPIGASTTARMSSSGPNVQNWSKKNPRMRGILLPEPGTVLVTADFAQVELRVVAALAREEKMIETILAGEDLHQLTADLVSERGVPITRAIGKLSGFLIVYGGGGKALHQQANIPLESAYEIVKTQREAYPSISSYSQYLGMEREAIRTVSGRRLPVTRVKGTGDRAGEIRAYANLNYAVQSAARELLADAWIRLEEGHNRPGIVWLPVHDELVLQVPEDEVDAVIRDVEEAMTFDFRGVPIKADAIVLRDEDGVSRWMTGDEAERVQKMVAVASPTVLAAR